MREDVTGTLQAAIADPDVAARLGRLVKAEQYSGFGDFGFTAEVATDKPDAKPEPDRDEINRAQAALAAAEKDKADARRRYEEAERELQAATERVHGARAQLKRSKLR